MIMNSQHRLSVELSLSAKGHCSLSVFGVCVCSRVLISQELLLYIALFSNNPQDTAIV